MQTTLLLYYFRLSSYVLREILKSQLLFIFTVLEENPADVPKVSRKNIRRVFGTSPERQFSTSRTNVFSMHYFQFYFTKCVLETLKSQLFLLVKELVQSLSIKQVFRKIFLFPDAKCISDITKPKYVKNLISPFLILL